MSGLDGHQSDVKEGNWIEVLALMNRYQPPRPPMSLEIVRDTIGIVTPHRGAIAAREEKEDQGVTENCPVGHITACNLWVPVLLGTSIL